MIRLLFAPETEDFAARIERALTEVGYAVGREDGVASAAIVIWSDAAGRSPEILSAARSALSRRVLVPVALGKAPPPPSFEHLWPMDLLGWAGGAEDPRWRFVLDEIELAVRRGVEIGFGATPTIQPVASAPIIAAKKAPAKVAAPVESEDFFAEPLTYRVEGKPRPRIPLVAIAAGSAVLGAAAAAAFLAGRPPAALPAKAIMAEQKDVRAELSAAPQSEPPVIAFVQQTEEWPAAEDAAAPPPVEDVAADVEIATSAIDKRATELRDQVAPLTIETPPPQQKQAPAMEAAADPAPREATPPVVTAAEPVAATVTSAPQSEDGADPIAGLAFNAVANNSVASALPSPEGETAALGRYFRDCIDCPDMAEIWSDGGAPFAIGVREVTFAQWSLCVEAGDCNRIQAGEIAGGDNLPVIKVSYIDALSYARFLSRMTGVTYRLPSEAEWNIASGRALAGAGSPVDRSSANVAGARGRTVPGGSFAPNANGLYDLVGNVWEWTMACSAAPGVDDPCKDRVVKGGAFDTAPATLSTADRASAPATARRVNVGFRVARDLP